MKMVPRLTNDVLEILVISLPIDKARRSRLQQYFHDSYDQFTFIDAVDFRSGQKAADKKQSAPCHRSHKKPLSPPEIGCALSHMRALEMAAKSRARSVLILEDDVIGGDQDIKSIAQIITRLPPHHFLLCGGQEGLRGTRFLYGKPHQEFYRLPSLILRFTARTCCYAISPSMAEKILEKQNAFLDRADHWHTLLKNESAVFFTQKLRHPLDLRESHLQDIRHQMIHLPLWCRIRADGVGYTVINQFIKVLLPVLSAVFGWEKVRLSP